MKKALRNLIIAGSLLAVIFSSGCTNETTINETTTNADISVTNENTSLARTVTVPMPGGLTSEFIFNEKGLLTNKKAEVFSGDPIDVYYTYDENSKLTNKKTLPLYPEYFDEDFICNTVYEYDENGNCILIDNNPADNSYYGSEKIIYDYDAQNRVISESHCFGNFYTEEWGTSYFYDDNGNVVKTINRNKGEPSVTSIYVYDSNKPVRKESENGETAGFTYDENGNLTAFLGNTYEYDESGRIIGVSYEDSYKETIEYNEDGRISKSNSIDPETKQITRYVEYTYFDNGNICVCLSYCEGGDDSIEGSVYTTEEVFENSVYDCYGKINFGNIIE